MKKNVAGQKVGAQMVSTSDGSAFTGSVTVSVTGDAGTQATGSVGSGACTHEGNGYHTYAPAQAETNYDLIAFTFTGSGAIPATIQVYPSFPQTGDAFTTATNVETDTQDIQSRLPAALVGGRIDANMGAISTDATAADNAESFFDGTGYAGTGNVIPTVTTLTNAPTDSSGTTTLLSRLTSTRAGYLDNLSAGAVALASTFTGITSLKEWLGLLAGKQTGNSTARTELRATGAGSGTYDETTDSLEANRDNIGTAGASLTAADDATITAIGALNNLSQANIRTAVGLASANLDTQLSTIDDFLDTEVAAILAAVDTEVASILALLDDPRTEPGQGAPPVNPDLATKVDYLYKLARNKITQDATTLKIYADDGSTVDHKSTVSDDGTTYTRGELATGP